MCAVIWRGRRCVYETARSWPPRIEPQLVGWRGATPQVESRGFEASSTARAQNTPQVEVRESLTTTCGVFRPLAVAGVTAGRRVHEPQLVGWRRATPQVEVCSLGGRHMAERARQLAADAANLNLWGGAAPPHKLRFAAAAIDPRSRVGNN